MLPRSPLSFILACCLFAGCAQTPHEAEVPAPVGTAESVPIELPATFTGHIPCPDCLRVDITLNLRPDFLYQLRKTYQTEQGPRAVEAQMSRWRYSPDGNLIVLGKERGALKTYAIGSEGNLRFLELESEDNETPFHYDLVRSPEVDPFADTVKMRGLYRIFDNRVEISECLSGVSFPVGPGGEFSEAVQSYANIPHNLGEPLLISIDGRLEGRPSGGERPEGEAIVIEHFKRFYPNEDCDGNRIRANLTDTYWRLIEVDGDEVTVAADQSKPYIVLGLDDTLRGFGGCNRLTGTYLVKGEIFLVKREPSARKACAGGVALENRFLEALDATETFRAEGEYLYFIDQNEQTRARFQAGL